jgi:hypothetical protein
LGALSIETRTPSSDLGDEVQVPRVLCCEVGFRLLTLKARVFLPCWPGEAGAVLMEPSFVLPLLRVMGTSVTMKWAPTSRI